MHIYVVLSGKLLHFAPGSCVEGTVSTLVSLVVWCLHTAVCHTLR